MKAALVTGSAGLIGSETCKRLAHEGYNIIGVDNDMRAYFFGAEASTRRTRDQLEERLSKYHHHAVDIRNAEDVMAVFRQYGTDIQVVVHTAAQPSHDWAARYAGDRAAVI